MKYSTFDSTNGRDKTAKPIRRNVRGAPFRIDELVQVIQIVDSTGSWNLVGQIGRVEYLEYSCGCGQSYPEDPMIGVAIGDQTDEFWKEELAINTPLPCALACGGKE
jgi:hypothetical protein